MHFLWAGEAEDVCQGSGNQPRGCQQKAAWDSVSSGQKRHRQVSDDWAAAGAEVSVRYKQPWPGNARQNPFQHHFCHLRLQSEHLLLYASGNVGAVSNYAASIQPAVHAFCLAASLFWDVVCAGNCMFLFIVGLTKVLWSSNFVVHIWDFSHDFCSYFKKCLNFLWQRHFWHVSCR